MLGLTARERRQLVLLECGLLGAVGSALGLLLGTGMAAAALRLLAGDLGGGYFPGIVPPLQVGAGGVLVFGLLGTASALVGGWVPALHAERIAPALALKGLGTPESLVPPTWPGVALLVLGTAAAFAPPIAGLPLPSSCSHNPGMALRRRRRADVFPVLRDDRPRRTFPIQARSYWSRGRRGKCRVEHFVSR